MSVKQGDLALLQDPASQELLRSKIPARLAYVWTDGTPRVIPIWFHWNGRELVMGTPPKAPKLKALAKNPKVSLTIDNNEFPHKVLLVRGTARLETVDGIVPEYAAAADRYFEPEQARAWLAQLRTRISSMVRVTVAKWVGLLDFKTRFPSALSSSAQPKTFYLRRTPAWVTGSGRVQAVAARLSCLAIFPPQREPGSAIEDCGQHQQ